jgi:hypothetical protein
MAGFGLQGAGVTTAGYGTVPDSTADDGRIFRDSATGARLSGRQVNPDTGDYEVDENGRILGMTTARQLVLFAIKTVRDSSAVKGMGNQLALIDRISSNFEQRILTILTDALKRPIALGMITVLGFSDFKKGPDFGLRRGAVYGRLRWRDNTTSTEHTEFV